MNVIDISMVFKLMLTFVYSFLFGLQRQSSHKPVGFGTFIFVSVGSCALTILAVIITPESPLILVGAIITGIGFLGAGALIKTGDKVFGATTAASIWVFSIIGILIGLENYLMATIVYFLVWFIVLMDSIFEKRGIGSYQRRLIITLNKNIHAGRLATILRTKRYKISNIDIDLEKKRYTLNLLVEGSKKEVNQIPKRLFELEELISFKIE